MKSLNLKVNINSFLEYLFVEKRLAKNTILSYKRDLKSLERFVSKQKEKTIESTTSTDIQDFISSDFKTGLSARTIQRKVSSIRAFFYFLKERRAISNNPAKNIRTPKTKSYLPSTIDPDQITRLLRNSGKTFFEIRDKTMLEIFYSCGLRLSELVGLNLRDISLQNSSLRVLGKGNKERVLPIGVKAKESLVHWLELILLPT